MIVESSGTVRQIEEGYQRERRNNLSGEKKGRKGYADYVLGDGDGHRRSLIGIEAG